MKIYTRTGDRGKTSLFDNTRVWKNSLRVDTNGTMDELNAALGIVTAEIGSSNLLSGKIGKEFKDVLNVIEQIQKDSFVLSSSLATPGSKVLDFDIVARVKDFEKKIDVMWKKCPPLTNFILPGGGRIGAGLHMARTISRRTERKLISLILEEEIDPLIIVYMNRLSDLLFTLSRYVNHIEHKKETIWRR